MQNILFIVHCLAYPLDAGFNHPTTKEKKREKKTMDEIPNWNYTYNAN